MDSAHDLPDILVHQIPYVHQSGGYLVEAYLDSSAYYAIDRDG